MTSNPYRSQMLRDGRQRVLRALVSDDLIIIFRDLGWRYPAGDVVQARYELLAAWNPEIERLVLEMVTRTIVEELALRA